jgi:hypothetical protein
MKRNKRKFAYTTCDDCIWWINSQKLTREEFDTAYKYRFPKQYQDHLDIQDKISKLPEDSIEACEYWYDYENMRNFELPHKCPFDFKPNLKFLIRINYKMQCFGCHQEFGCPGEIMYDSLKRPLCEVCYADIGPDYDPHDDFDEDKAYEQALVRKYGEC